MWLERPGPKKGRVPQPAVLAVRVSGEEEKHALIADNPDIYFTEDRYNGYPAVLVRLAAIGADELEEILSDAWRHVAPRRLMTEFADQYVEQSAPERAPTEQFPTPTRRATRLVLGARSRVVLRLPFVATRLRFCDTARFPYRWGRRPPSVRPFRPGTVPGTHDPGGPHEEAR